MTSVKVLAITHQGCTDGAGAAWIIDKYYRVQNQIQTDYIYEIKHNRVDPSRVKEFIQTLKTSELNEIIISADVGYTAEDLQELLRIYPNMIIIDHHISSFRSIIKYNYFNYLNNHRDIDITGLHVNDIEKNTVLSYFEQLNQNLAKTSPFRKYLPNNYYFDINESGASLTWKYFYGDAIMPQTLKYIQAKDTWQFNLVPNAEIVSLGLYEMIPHTPIENNWTIWDDFIQNETENLKKAQEIGQIMYDIMMKKIWGHYKRCTPFTLEIDGHKYKGASINTTDYTSELGNFIVNQKDDGEYVYDFAFIWYYRNDGKFKCSLRSRKNGCDVSKIAERLGGGGHAAASACVLNNIFSLIQQTPEYNEIESTNISSLIPN